MKAILFGVIGRGSIRQKLRTVTMSTAVVAVLVAVGIIVALDYLTFRACSPSTSTRRRSWSPPIQPRP